MTVELAMLSAKSPRPSNSPALRDIGATGFLQVSWASVRAEGYAKAKGEAESKGCYNDAHVQVALICYLLKNGRKVFTVTIEWAYGIQRTRPGTLRNATRDRLALPNAQSFTI
jgi:hypothetical protein